MATYASLTDASFMKIDRARKHIEDLEREIQTYLSERPFRFMTRNDPEASRHTHFVKQNAPIPKSIPLVLGDAIHNLRCALDLAIFAMVGDKTNAPDAVQFPFPKRAEALGSAIRSRQVHLAGPEIVKEIEGLQPYPGGNELLTGLHALDIADKHKLILVVGSTGMLTGPDFPSSLFADQPGVEIVFSQNARFHLPVEGGQREREAYWRANPSGEYERAVQPTFAIAFGEGPNEPFTMRPVMEIMPAMASEVGWIVERLANVYLSNCC